MNRILPFMLLILSCSVAYAQDSSYYSQSEIIYGRKDGMALTMLKLTPKQDTKGKAIISVVSGNWVSGMSMLYSFTRRAGIYIRNGYTMFLVMHGSQPRYSIPDEMDDIKRAVRFIRHHATEYGIDSMHIGITGSSSGGHLALMTALSDDKPPVFIRDAADRVSAKIQAAAVYFPPVDFLNWGGKTNASRQELMRKARVTAAFDFKKINDSTGVYDRITDEEQIKKIALDIAPINQVTAGDPPIIIAHGDADPIVPLQQSESLIKALKEAGIPNELIIKPGGSHGWNNSEEQDLKFIAWFDKYLK